MLRRLAGRALQRSRAKLATTLASPHLKPSVDTIQQYVQEAKNQYLLNNKPEKKEDDEDDEDKEKTFNEQLKDYWKDPRAKGGFLIIIGGIVLICALSENIKDIVGVEFFMYSKIGVLELEELISRGEVASIRILAYTGDFNDEYKALIVTKLGSKKVFNVINPDSFINFISEVQNKNGTTLSEQVPFKLDYKTPLYKNLAVYLDVGYHLMLGAMFIYTILSVRKFIKTMKNNISGQGSLV